MTSALTPDYLDRALKSLATKDDVYRLQAGTVSKEEFRDGLNGLRSEFADLQSSVDRYLKRTEMWHDELTVLQSRFTQVVHLLDQKGLIREEETHVG